LLSASNSLLLFKGKQGENLLLPFLLANVPKEKVAPKEKDFRPRYAKLAMQLLRLGSGEKTLHTFFLNDQKVKPHVHFLLNGQKKVNRKKSRRRCFIGRLLHHNICGWNVTFSLSTATKKK